MATIGIALAAQQSPPSLVQADFAPGPQANATPAQDPAQQDVVTLAGRAAENGRTRTGTDDSRLGEAAAFFFAEQQSFRAANGSGGSQTTRTPSVPELPVKLTTSGPAAQNAASGTITDAPRNSAERGTDASQQGAVASSASNPANNAISAVSKPANETVDTPLAELTQLDRTLQQIGINPQSISLFNRMAMLLYANDPAALKILVQTLQSGAQQLSTDSNARTTNVNQATSGASSAPVQQVLSARTQTSDAYPATQNGSGSALRTTLVAQPPFELQRDYSPESAQAHLGTDPDSPEPNDAARADTSQTGPPELTNFPLQLVDLSVALAAAGAPQLSSEPLDTPPGQLLNVMF